MYIMFRKENMYNCFWFHQYRKMSVLYHHHDTIVYLAQHVKLLDLCIIKQISRKSSYYDQGLMEAMILKSLQHIGIPALYNLYETEEAIFLIEEYKEGVTLYSICQTEQLSYYSILSYGIQLCDILHYLHSQTPQVLHLDINPNNIIVHQEQVSLIDYSASIRLERKKYNGSRYGTLGYAAPEQFCRKPLDIRTDIYSFGKTLEMMVGQLEKRKEITKGTQALDKIIRTCTHSKKSRRYHSIQQVGSLLSKLYQEENSNNPKKEFNFVVAGTQNRIGTTHLALLLSSYLRTVYGDCLYVEKNQTRNAAYLIREEKRLGETGFYEYEQIPIMIFTDKEGNKNRAHSFSCTVTDLGVLSKENIHEFMKYTHRILVFGGKAHELSKTLNCLDLFPSMKKTYFLENFSSKHYSKEILAFIPKQQRFCFPYEPDLTVKRDSAIFSLLSIVVKGAENEE